MIASIEKKNRHTREIQLAHLIIYTAPVLQPRLTQTRTKDLLDFRLREYNPVIQAQLYTDHSPTPDHDEWYRGLHISRSYVPTPSEHQYSKDK
jgi:hypothetical protein